MVFCMSDWFVERVFTWYTVQIRDDTICNQCTRHCGVRVFYLDGISLKLVRLQFDLNSTMAFSTHTYAFLERFLAETGDPREVECLV